MNSPGALLLLDSRMPSRILRSEVRNRAGPIP